MAKGHWKHEQGHGCQQKDCTELAVYQWQRQANDQEIQKEMSVVGNYGAVIRSLEGLHNVAVFSCEEHRLDVERMALRHEGDCPAPDEGCRCE